MCKRNKNNRSINYVIQAQHADEIMKEKLEKIKRMGGKIISDEIIFESDLDRLEFEKKGNI